MKKPEDTEDKEPWLEYGKLQEAEFLEKIAPRLNLDIKMNPEKEKNEAAIDFICNGKRTDLKKQGTPFFKAGQLYGINPQYCVTFNTNDYWSYIQKYEPREVDIIFWVDWEVLELFGISVEKMHGVWEVGLEEIKNRVDSHSLPINYYRRRRNDKRGNAPASYLLDLQEMELLACFEGPCKQRASS